MQTGKRVLVTGIAGFTGRYAAAELDAAGYEVYGIGERHSDLPRYTQVNLEDKGALRELVARIQPQAVLHLAALAFVGADDSSRFYAVNTVGSVNLLEALAANASDLEAVLIASSANVYGNSTGGVLDESTALNPANHYAMSKVAMEYMARLWSDRLPIAIARPFNYTGVGQSAQFLIPKIVDHFKRGERRIELGNLDVYRDFSDVRAVVNAYRRLLERRICGTTINVCSGQAHSLHDVIRAMQEMAGYEIEVRVNPAFVRANEVRILQGTAERLRSMIGEWTTPPLYETLSWMYRAK